MLYLYYSSMQAYLFSHVTMHVGGPLYQISNNIIEFFIIPPNQYSAFSYFNAWYDFHYCLRPYDCYVHALPPKSNTLIRVFLIQKYYTNSIDVDLQIRCVYVVSLNNFKNSDMIKDLCKYWCVFLIHLSFNYAGNGRMVNPCSPIFLHKSLRVDSTCNMSPEA